MISPQTGSSLQARWPAKRRFKIKNYFPLLLDRTRQLETCNHPHIDVLRQQPVAQWLRDIPLT
jgi:hypothetical protein